MDQTLPPNTNMQKNVSFGLRLATTREALGMDCKEAALQLRLPEKIIIMMEKGEFNTEVPLAFLRGYLKNYSKLLAIPEEEVKEVLESLRPQVENKENDANLSQNETKPMSSLLSARFSANEFNPFFMRLLTYVIAMTLILLVGIWWHTHKSTLNQPLNQTTHTIPVKTATATNSPSYGIHEKSLHIIKKYSHKQIISFAAVASLLIAFIYFYAKYPLHRLSSKSRRIHKHHVNLFIKSNYLPKIFEPIMTVFKKKKKWLVMLISVVVFSFLIFNALEHYKQTQQQTIIAANQNKAKKPTSSMQPSMQIININVLANLQLLAPDPELNKKLARLFKSYFLYVLINQLDAYIHAAAAVKFDLTDPSTPLGQFTYVVKPHKLRTVKKRVVEQPHTEDENVPPYFRYQYNVF